MNPRPDDELGAFLDGSLDPAGFDHRTHVRIARRILDGHDFLEAAHIYDRSIQKIASRAGFPDKRSVTKTLAFLALIAEGDDTPDPQSLTRWYTPDRLSDPQAREVFLLPDRYLSEFDHEERPH